MYILFTKGIETIWSREVTKIWVLEHFELKIQKDFWTYQVFMYWTVLNLLEQNVSKSEKKNCEKNYIKPLCAKLF